MKNVFKVLGIIALVAVIGFSMVACGDDDDDDGGGGALTPDSLGANSRVDWKNDATGAQINFDTEGNDLTCYILDKNNATVADGKITISNNTVTWADGTSCIIKLSSDGKKLTISGFTGNNADQINGSYRKR
jgi:hypothetical protein